MADRRLPPFIVALLCVVAVVIVFWGGSGRASTSVIPPTFTSSPSPAMTASRPSSPSPAPTATRAFSQTPPPYPTLAARTSLVVYLIDGDLWLASLDGSTVPPRALTSGATNAGYAGTVRTAGGEELYYVAQTGPSNTDPHDPSAPFAVYRMRLETGEREEVLQYRSRALEPIEPTNAAVAPDGAHLAYTNQQGLWFVDLRSGDKQQLLANGPCERGTQDCYGYHNPQWSPTGAWLKTNEYFWEGGTVLLLDPFADHAQPIDTKMGGLYNAWSPDGARICSSEGSYSFIGRTLVYDVTSGTTADATAGLDVPPSQSPDLPPVDTAGCAWSTDGRLAFDYREYGKLEMSRISIVDSTYRQLGLSDESSQSMRVADWLPDGSGVIFNRYSKNGAPLQSGIYRPASGIEDLPFLADTVLAVIP